MTTPPTPPTDNLAAEGGPRSEMSEHKWVDVRGWGGALPGTEQCDYCNRVASPTDPKRAELLASDCKGKRR